MERAKLTRPQQRVGPTVSGQNSAPGRKLSTSGAERDGHGGGQPMACGVPQEIVTCPIFAGIDPKIVATIARWAHIERLPAGRLIIQEGDRATRLYILRSGRAKFYKPTKEGEEILLQWLDAGSAFGIGSLVGDAVCYVGTAETLSTCEIWSWDRATIQHFSALRPALAENALRIVIGYMHTYLQKHVRLTSGPAEPRLAGALLALADRSGAIEPRGVQVEVTNEELAELTHISPFTVSRMLNRWKRSGVISKERSKVLVRTPEALMASDSRFC